MVQVHSGHHQSKIETVKSDWETIKPILFKRYLEEL